MGLPHSCIVEYSTHAMASPIFTQRNGQPLIWELRMISGALPYICVACMRALFWNLQLLTASDDSYNAYSMLYVHA